MLPPAGPPGRGPRPGPGAHLCPQGPHRGESQHPFSCSHPGCPPCALTLPPGRLQRTGDRRGRTRNRAVSGTQGQPGSTAGVPHPRRLPPSTSSPSLGVQQGRKDRGSPPTPPVGPWPDGFCNSSRWGHAQHPNIATDLPKSGTHLSLRAQSHSLTHGRPCRGCSTGGSHVRPSFTPASLTAPSRAMGPLCGPDPHPGVVHKDPLQRTRSQAVKPTEPPASHSVLPACVPLVPSAPTFTDGAPQDGHTGRAETEAGTDRCRGRGATPSARACTHSLRPA